MKIIHMQFSCTLIFCFIYPILICCKAIQQNQLDSYIQLLDFRIVKNESYCRKYEQKLNEFQEAIKFSDETSQSFLFQITKSLYKMRNIGKNLEQQLQMHQQNLIDIKAQRKARELFFRKENKQNELSIHLHSFIQLDNLNQIQNKKTEIGREMSELNILEMQKQIYEQKINQTCQENQQWAMELSEVELKIQTIQKMIKFQENSQEKLQNLENEVNNSDSIHQQEESIQKNKNQLVSELEKFEMEKGQITLKKIEKQNLNQKLQQKRLEIQEQITEKSIQITKLKQNSSSQQITKEQQILENQLFYLISSEQNITESMLKTAQIITIIQQEITTINCQENKSQQVIQNLTANQYEIKVQMGVAQAEKESFENKILIIQETGSNKEELSELNKKLKDSQNNLQQLNSSYYELQKQIDSSLIQSNLRIQRLIDYKKQLIDYEQESKEYEQKIIKIKNEENSKQVEIQNEKEDYLEKKKENLEKLKDQIEQKKIKRDVVCDYQNSSKIDNITSQNITKRNEVEKTQKESYKTFESSNFLKIILITLGQTYSNRDEKQKAERIEIAKSHNQEGKSIQFNESCQQTSNNQERQQQYNNPKKNQEYSWEQYIKERDEQKKHTNYTVHQREKPKKYDRQQIEEEAYDIKHRLQEMLNNELKENSNDKFVQDMSIKLEKYMKILKKKEDMLRVQEISLNKRSIQMDEKEIHLQRYISKIENDLYKCQLDIPEVKKQAVKIKGYNQTENLRKDILEKQAYLKEQTERNNKEEYEIEQKEIKTSQLDKDIDNRNKQFKENTNTKHDSIQQTQHYNQTLQQESSEQNEFIKESNQKTSEQKQKVEALRKEEEALDKQLEAYDSQSDENLEISNQLDLEKQAIQDNKDKITKEQQKIEGQKQQLIEQKGKLEEQIQQCKLDSENNSNDEQTKQRILVCMTSREKFIQDKEQIEEQLVKYEELQRELNEEKEKFEVQKQEIQNLKLIHFQKHYPQFQLMFVQVKQKLNKDSFQEYIHNQLKIVHNLTECLSKEEKKLTISQNINQNSMIKEISSEIQEITQQMNLILSQYPENQGLFFQYNKQKEILEANLYNIKRKIDDLLITSKKVKTLSESRRTLQKQSKQLVKLLSKCQSKTHKFLLIQNQKKKKQYLQ